MAIERLVGLHVVDDQEYQAYRDAMTPLLLGVGGGFGYDFRIAEVLKSATEAPINRVITIFFPDKATENRSSLVGSAASSNRCKPITGASELRLGSIVFCSTAGDLAVQFSRPFVTAQS